MDGMRLAEIVAQTATPVAARMARVVSGPSAMPKVSPVGWYNLMAPPFKAPS